MVKSNQRITKIKRDPIEELLKKAEATDVENACQVQPQGMDLTPYPDMSNLRLWVRDYLLKGLNVIYNNDLSSDGQTYMTTIVDGLPLFTKLSKTIKQVPGTVNFEQPVLVSNGSIGGTSFATYASNDTTVSPGLSSYLTQVGTVNVSSDGIISGFGTNNYIYLQGTSEWQAVGYEYILDFTTGSNVSGIQTIGQSEYFMACEIDNGSLIEYNYGSGRNVTLLESVQVNTNYIIKVVYTSNTQRVYYDLTDGTETLLATINDSSQQLGIGQRICFGRHTSITYRVFAGSINGITTGCVKSDKLYSLTQTGENHDAFNVTNSLTGYWESDGSSNDNYLILYNPSEVTLSSFTLSNKLCTSSSYIPTLITVQGSNTNDGSDWITLKEVTNSNTEVGTSKEYSFDVNSQYGYKYTKFILSGSSNTLQVGYLRLNGTIPDGLINVETTKPGLWLSNLCEPYQVSQAGGWLRQNLINDYYKEYTNLNSDTIGNYSFSYFQRGIIHRDAGSTHADNDSYCQHWSPSALGCISHDSLIIPTNNLRNTYTSYQTLAVPSNVDKQSYFETMSKDVNFTFVDNNNNIPLSTTTFNGRVVGDGWQYEFVFEPNYGGSGNNYGETTNDVPNGSNGGCVTGQITYTLDNGDMCVQNINKCFVTDQALFNPYNHSTGDALNNDNDNTFIMPIGISGEGINGTVLDKMPTPGKYYIASLTGSCSNSGEVYLVNDDGTQSTTSQSWQYDTWYGTGNCRPIPFGISNMVHSCSGCGTCFRPYGCGSGTLYLTETLEPQTNVTIYLNIWDLQKEYAAQGLPWAYTCEYDRFRVEISTQPCSDWYCKSFVIAENVDINDLGDISALQRIVFSGG